MERMMDIQQNAVTISGCQEGVLDLTALCAMVSVVITVLVVESIKFYSRQLQENKTSLLISLAMQQSHVYHCRLTILLF